MRKGRPRKPLPVHPNKVIANAIQRGLSGTLEMQREIKNSITRELYLNSRNILLPAREVYRKTKENGKPDFTYITKAEPSVRRNLLSMLYENAAAYGNTEVLRITNSLGTIGPLNILLNNCGAGLRDFAMIMYPFPEPEFFGTRIKHIGNKESTFRITGYDENSSGSKVELIHSDLPSLDFIDAIRHHLDYIATFCHNYDVPPRETGRYWNLFQLRVKPHLDYIYSENRIGRSGFRVGTNTVLRFIKDDIRTHYRLGRKDKETVTDRSKQLAPKFSFDFFETQISEAESAGIQHTSLNELKRVYEQTVEIWEKILAGEDVDELPLLTKKDVQYIWTYMNERGKRKGTLIHRTISAQFPGPWNIRRAILNESLLTTDGYLLCSEIPLETETGRGKADLVLFRREVTANGLQVLFRPVMVLEIKTQSAFTWFLDSKWISSLSRARHHSEEEHPCPQRVVPELIISDRALDKNEWTRFEHAMPDEKTTNQVDAYASSIEEEYVKIAGPDTPSTILKGTLLIDHSEDLELIRPLVRSLIIEAFESTRAKAGHIHRTIFTPKVDKQIPHAALMLHKQVVQRDQLDPIDISWNELYDPLEGTDNKRSRFILYLTGRSPISAGVSAAWISKYYHGLRYLHDLTIRDRKTEVIWFDMIDAFTEPLLAEARLRLLPYGKTEPIIREQLKIVREFFESVQIEGMFNHIQKCIFEDGKFPSISTILGETGKGPRIIVVSGFDFLKDSIPEQYRERLSRFAVDFIAQLPDDDQTTVLWFDSPVPAENVSKSYSTRVLRPFFKSSPLSGIVNEIIWNLPVPPLHEVEGERCGLPIISKAPYYDDIRVIVTQTTKGFDCELTHVPILNRWSRRFRSAGWGIVTNEISNVQEIVPEKSTRDKMKALALTILPWLVDLWPGTRINGESTARDSYQSVISDIHKTTTEFSIKQRVLKRPPRSKMNLLARTKFRPKGVMLGKSHHSLSNGKINSQRLYRGPTKLKTKAIPITHQPSEEKDLYKQDKFRFMQVLSISDREKWISIEDLWNPGKIQVNLFAGASMKRLQWNADRLDMIQAVQSTSLRTLDSTYLLTHEVQDGWFAWQWRLEDNRWVPRGALDIVPARGSLGILRAGQIVPHTLPKQLPSSFPKPPNNMTKRTIRAVQRLYSIHKKAKEVEVKLELSSKGCEVSFIDHSGRTLWSIIIKVTAELISILKWPLTYGRPLRTSEGHYLIWDIFTDIDYGEMSGLRPLVETYVSKTSPIQIPSDVSKFGRLPKSKMLRFLLQHDLKQCAVTKGEKEHKSCWDISLLGEFPRTLEERFSSSMTSRDVYQLLAGGWVCAGNKLYSVHLSLSPKRKQPGFVVFHEDYWIRRLLGEYGVKLHGLSPSTFLKECNQKWVVSISNVGNQFRWNATSTITGLKLSEIDYGMEMHPEGTLIETERDITDYIFSKVKPISIKDPKELKRSIREMLRKLGFVHGELQAHVVVSRRENTIFWEVIRGRRPTGITLKKGWFSVNDNDDIEMTFNRVTRKMVGHIFSQYEVINIQEFESKLYRLFEEIANS